MTDYSDLTWGLAAMSIIGLTLIIHTRMIIGTLINLISTLGWVTYYASIQEYSTVALLSTYSCIYLYGFVKHVYRWKTTKAVSDVSEPVVEELNI